MTKKELRDNIVMAFINYSAYKKITKKEYHATCDKMIESVLNVYKIMAKEGDDDATYLEGEKKRLKIKADKFEKLYNKGIWEAKYQETKSNLRDEELIRHALEKDVKKLKKYVEHKFSCPIAINENSKYGLGIKKAKCTCGLDELLEPKKN